MSARRNDPCPCGSGQKYKKCCGLPENAAAPQAAVDPHALLQQAMRHHQAGQLAQAEGLYRQILAVRPKDSNALQLLGLIHHQNGQHALAAELMGKAVAQNPGVAEWQVNLGSVYVALDDWDAAQRHYRAAIRLNPSLAEAYACLGGALLTCNHPVEAAEHLRAALRLNPALAEAELNLGIALHRQGKPTNAATHYRQALQLRPDYAEAHFNLGNAWQDEGEIERAIAAYLQALALRPGYAKAHVNLGNALRRRARIDDAIAHYRSAIEAAPDFPDAYSNLAAALLAKKGGAAEAAIHARRAVALAPHHADGWNNLCAALQAGGDLREAEAAGRRAVELQPGLAAAHNNLGSALQEQGRVDEAIVHYRQAAVLDPAYHAAHSNLLFALNFMTGQDAGQVYAEHLAWGNQRTEDRGQRTERRLDVAPLPSDSSRAPIRVGYVSPDFRSHAVAWFIEPVLAHHDKAGFDIYCYASVAEPDQVTARLHNLVPHWRDIAAIGDDAAAALIRADRIDILVDLAGHTAGGRLPLFAHKPAPLQMGYLGYLNTTGLAAMDYRISDGVMDRPGLTEAYHCEKLIRLPHSQWCYQPPADSPPVGALPALANGGVTFAGFNNFAKITPTMIALWGRILQALPASRLLAPVKDTEVARAAFGRIFAPLGIDIGRVEFLTTLGFEDYLRLHQKVDIALDTFPYNGATTTCHALWMGVPTITLSGANPPMARSGASLLAALGLDEFCASEPGEYLTIAVRLANDLEKLNHLRQNLRAMMLNSPLTDARRFTADLEAAYRRAWREWCAQGNEPAQAP
ncbi:MAG: tetratricopeptide repeat protein [Sulfuricellaceae bacterium]